MEVKFFFFKFVLDVLWLFTVLLFNVVWFMLDLKGAQRHLWYWSKFALFSSHSTFWGSLSFFVLVLFWI